MVVLDKFEMHEMDSEELRKRRDLMLSILTKGKGSRALRNLLYDLIGVMEFKNKFQAPLLLGS